MPTETETSHNHPKTHDGANDGEHKTARIPKATKRPSTARKSKSSNGDLAGVLTLGGLTTSAAEGFSERLSELKETGLQTAKALEQRMVKHPKSTVLIAFGAGYLWARLRKWL